MKLENIPGVKLIGKTIRIPAALLSRGRLILESRRAEEGILRFNPKAQNMVALTFDDGPSPKFTPVVLEILKEYDAKATFFLIGKNVRKYPELSRKILSEGHEIGNHTYTHSPINSMLPPIIRSEIEKCRKTIFEATGVSTKYFRPPYGFYNMAVKKEVARTNHQMVLWSLRTFDSSYGVVRKKMIEGLVLRRIKAGDIILMHDSKSAIKNIMDNNATIKALPIILEYIKSIGLKAVTVSELFSRYA